MVWALLEIAWTIWLGFDLPRRYVANHWDAAWVGLDGAQVLVVAACAWAAWRRRAIVILFAVAAATLLLVDAWFDVLTSRYQDLDQSLALLGAEIPGAIFLLWIARRAFSRAVGVGLWRAGLPHAGEGRRLSARRPPGPGESA